MATKKAAKKAPRQKVKPGALTAKKKPSDHTDDPGHEKQKPADPHFRKKPKDPGHERKPKTK